MLLVMYLARFQVGMMTETLGEFTVDLWFIDGIPHRGPRSVRQGSAGRAPLPEETCAGASGRPASSRAPGSGASAKSGEQASRGSSAAARRRRGCPGLRTG